VEVVELRFDVLHGTRPHGNLAGNVISSALSRLGFVAALVVTMLISASAQQKEATPKNPVPLESLLNGPDHADMPWKVQFSEPRLMYQQQYLLEIRIRIPAEILDAGGKQHVLHFLAKVEDGKGRWFEGDQYNRFEPAAELGNTKVVQCDMAIYLRPGDYTVAMIAFDSTSNQSNIARKKIDIPPISSDPIPELNSHIPVVEFPSNFPQQEVSRTDRSDGELFPVGQLTPLQVSSRDRIRIDIVLNVSRISEPDRQWRHTLNRGYPNPLPPRVARSISYSENNPKPSELALGRVLQVASVLSRVSPVNGCVFVTAVDPIRMQIALPTKLSSEINWVEAQKELTKSDQSMIDVPYSRITKGQAFSCATPSKNSLHPPQPAVPNSHQRCTT
jgi:hypothetical protein